MVDDMARLARQNVGEERAMHRAYYLKLGSGKSQLMGSSRDRYHVGWIKLLAFAQPNTGTYPAGAGTVKFSEFVVSKLQDRSSSEIFRAVHEGRHFNSADVDLADTRTGIPRVRFSFTDVLLDAFTANRDMRIEDQVPSESFSLKFAGMKLNHNPIPEETVGDLLQTVFKGLGLAPAQQH